LNYSKAFFDFLEFEQTVFAGKFPISHYDPYFIRYGEYKFLLENLHFKPGETVLDLGCEANIFMLYLATKGLKVIGVDIDAHAGVLLEEKRALVESTLRQRLDVTFRVEDATALTLEPESVDKVIAISSIEHMFSAKGHGDYLAVEGIGRVLKLGGQAIITLPMSNGNPFHESPTGDAGFGYSYRLYTPEALQERIFNHAGIARKSLKYLAHTTPDHRFDEMHFLHFWLKELSAEERAKWAWANPFLADLINPVVSQAKGESRLRPVNTALIWLEKIDPLNPPVEPAEPVEEIINQAPPVQKPPSALEQVLAQPAINLAEVENQPEVDRRDAWQRLKTGLALRDKAIEELQKNTVNLRERISQLEPASAQLQSLQQTLAQREQYIRQLENNLAEQEHLSHQLKQVYNDLRALQNTRTVKTSRTLGMVAKSLKHLAKSPVQKPLFGTLDYPLAGTVITGHLEVTGWAISSKGWITGVQVFLEDTLLGTAQYGLERRDVLQALPFQIPGNYGFSGSFEVKGVAKGSKTLLVKVVDNKGHQAEFKRHITI
jgi:SAM-dependent methyltransferase